MRLLLMICFVASFTFVSCDNTTESVTQETEQAKLEVKQSVVEATTIEDTVEETETDTKIVETKKVPSAPKQRPILSFNKKTFDYGMIEQGDKVNHTFSFTNKGNSNLIIKNAEASCGCTTPTYPFTPIKPGETGVISVTFNSTGKMGTQRPNIKVTSNAYPRTQTLYLEGFVTHKAAKEEKTSSLIEENVNINLEENTTKGGDVEVPVENTEEDNN